jgi:DNA repair metallo-beta-lactamase.
MMFRRISLLNLNPERFSTNEEDGFIHVVKGEQMKGLYERNQNQIKTIGIWLSGWCKNYSRTEDRGVVCYKIPYSLHSNSEELMTFVKGINADRVIFTSSCAKKSKGNQVIMENTYNRVNNMQIPLDLSPVKRRLEHPQKSVLKKVKNPKTFGSKIK